MSTKLEALYYWRPSSSTDWTGGGPGGHLNWRPTPSTELGVLHLDLSRLPLCLLKNEKLTLMLVVGMGPFCRCVKQNWVLVLGLKSQCENQPTPKIQKLLGFYPLYFEEAPFHLFTKMTGKNENSAKGGAIAPIAPPLRPPLNHTFKIFYTSANWPLKTDICNSPYILTRYTVPTYAMGRR